MPQKKFCRRLTVFLIFDLLIHLMSVYTYVYIVDLYEVNEQKQTKIGG